MSMSATMTYWMVFVDGSVRVIAKFYTVQGAVTKMIDSNGCIDGW